MSKKEKLKKKLLNRSYRMHLKVRKMMDNIYNTNLTPIADCNYTKFESYYNKYTRVGDLFFRL